MRKPVIIIIALAGCLLATNTRGNSISTTNLTKESTQASAPEEIQLSNTDPRPGKSKGMRRMRNKIFTVNVFNYNKKIRQKRDKELKVLAKGKKSPKARRANKKSKHILLRNNDANHGFKNKRRW